LHLIFAFLYKQITYVKFAPIIKTKMADSTICYKYRITSVLKVETDIITRIAVRQ